MKAIYLCEKKGNIAYVYGPRERQRLAPYAGEAVYSLEEAARSPEGRQAEAIFSTWGMPHLEEAEIPRLFPNLRAVFYAAGSVQHFAAPFLNRNIAVFSAWQANAVPVAEYTVAQMALAAKGYFRVQALCRQSRQDAARAAGSYPGMYEIKIGLLGMGAVGRRVASMLRAYECTVLACDPYAHGEVFEKTGAIPATMEEIFRECHIVSNHLPNLPSTRGLITRKMLFSMREGATFLNTGRGPQLQEADLYDLLREKPGTTALLDVLTDEADSDENPLNRLPNCFITPHIAGSMGNEVHRMARYMADEFFRWQAGQEPMWQVTAEMLSTMA